MRLFKYFCSCRCRCSIGTAAYRNASANTNLTIGGNTDTYMWNGSIATFYLHNKVLSEAEITQNFNALKSRFGL
jgi:hypothetical protein